uniref:Uncharacterized protein n=1 Tax=Lepeophtheirus salmonis TaxID=72036 RepID=A0A0K2V783_LEPSM
MFILIKVLIKYHFYYKYIASVLLF